MNYQIRILKMAILALVLAMLSAPAFGQTTDNSTWNGGTGFWNVSSEWTTNGQLATVYPNNTASTVFNVTIDSGQQDIVTLAGPPAITVNSLTLDGNPNFSSTLAIGVNGGAAGMLTLGSNTSAASLVVNSMGNLDVNAQSELLLNIAAGNGTVTNNGIINVGSASGTGTLAISDSGNVHSLTLKGTGTLTMQPGSVIQGVSGDEELINSSTIQGSGTISNLFLENNGTIDANGAAPLVIDSNPNPVPVFGLGAHNGAGLVNTGTAEVSAGSTLVLNTSAAADTEAAIANISGVIQVGDGGTLEVVGAANHTTGFGNAFGAQINVGGTGAGGTLELNGSNASFDLYGSGGLLTLSDNANNLITGVTGTETFINDTGQTLSGAGTITNLQLVNNGTIIANGTNALNITPNSLGFTNNGTVQVNAGSTLVLDTTVASSPHEFNGLNNSGVGSFLDGGTLEFKDTSGKTAFLDNEGAISVSGGTLQFDGAGTTFDLFPDIGSGTLTLSDNANNLITGVTGTETFINDTGETLSGAGTISNLALVNNGTIIANGTNPLNIKPNSSGFTNNGTVQVNAGSTLNSSGVYTQDAGQTDVNGTLIAASLAIKGGTLASGGGIVETQFLANGASITTDSMSVIVVGSGTPLPVPGYQQLANGTLDELIASTTSFGTIDVTGSASLDGTLDVTLENGFIPTVGDQFAFLDFTPGDLTGTFADFLDQMFDNGAEKWGLDYNNAGGDLVLTAEANTTTTTPEPASLLLFGTGLLGLAVLLRRRPGLGAWG